MTDFNEKSTLNQHEIETQVEKWVREDNVESATKFLAENAISAATKNDFRTAEELRDRLLTVNPNALFDVIRVNKVIDKEKKNAISRQYIELWHKLYGSLEPDAFYALYHCQHSKEYQAEEVIVRQGELQSTLFFINEGRVALTYRQGPKEVYIKQMNPGEIIGEGPFFDVSVWTVSLVAVTPVKMRTLERQDFLKLATYHPGLEFSLADFCHRTDDIPALLKKLEENRRQDMRHSVQLVVLNTIINQNEILPKQQFKAQLDDISLGGLSLTIRMSQKEKTRLLLGKCIVSFLPAGPDNTIQERSGEIVGVTLYDYLERNYSVHVRFDQPMTKEEIMTVLALGKKK